MLHGIVRIKKLRPDRANFGPLNMLGHNREPVAFDHFRVVIQEKQPRAVGLFDRKIVDRGKIEGPADNAGPGVWIRARISAGFFAIRCRYRR